MNKQELITRIKCLDEPYLKEEFILDLIEQLDEPQKPVVKQVVADWYEENKNNLDKNIYDCIVGWVSIVRKLGIGCVKPHHFKL